MTREVVWDHGVSLPGHRLWLDPFEGGHRWNGVQAQKFLEKWL